MPDRQTTTPLALPKLPSRIGRQVQWENLCSWLEQSASGQGGLGILTGPAGSGKSFLTRHLENEARQRGFSTGHGRFERRGRSRMPWPWPQVLRGLGGKETTQLARELMQEALAAPREEREGLGNVTHVPLLRSFRRHVLAVEMDGAGIGGLEAEHDAEQDGLA